MHGEGEPRGEDIYHLLLFYPLLAGRGAATEAMVTILESTGTRIILIMQRILSISLNNCVDIMLLIKCVKLDK